jgi:hypothetical protein
VRHHVEAACFAALCLAYVLTRRPVAFFTQAVLGHSPLNPKENR